MMQHVPRLRHSHVAQVAERGPPFGVLGGAQPEALQRFRFGGIHPEHRRLDLLPARVNLLVAIEHRVDDLVRRVAAQHHFALLRLPAPVARQKFGTLRRQALVALPQPFSQLLEITVRAQLDRKSTRLNSSHLVISYAVFCLKKKKKNTVMPTFVNVTALTDSHAMMSVGG